MKLTCVTSGDPFVFKMTITYTLWGLMNTGLLKGDTENVQEHRNGNEVLTERNKRERVLTLGVKNDKWGKLF